MAIAKASFAGEKGFDCEENIEYCETNIGMAGCPTGYMHDDIYCDISYHI